MRHSEKGLYNALEKILRDKGQPMDCNQLFDMPEVREYAATANRVSDYLGGLWRKGFVTRLPTASTEGGSRARWSYQWKETTSGAPAVGVEYSPRLLVDRPSVTITEEGLAIHISTPHLQITIRQTKP
jgi:hypothetical protein